MVKSFDDILAKVKECSTKTVAVAVAQDDAVLEACKAAKERGIANSILVGDADKIKEIASSLSMNIDDYEIIDVKDVTEAALTAVKLVHDGKADMYMKGLIDTKGFLKSVLDKEVGLRTGKPLSHVCVFDVEGIDHLLFLTDVAFIPYPTLEDKVNIINNTVEICNACGIENPKVAPLAAVEVVNPKMPATVEAAIHKGCTDRKIQGDADVLLFPDIHAGNICYKSMVHTATKCILFFTFLLGSLHGFFADTTKKTKNKTPSLWTGHCFWLPLSGST